MDPFKIKQSNPIQQKKKLDTNRFVEDKTFDNFAKKKIQLVIRTCEFEYISYNFRTLKNN